MSVEDERYPAALRALHWVMALLLPLQGALGWWAERVSDTELGRSMMQAHLELGVVLLGLVLLRLAVRSLQPPPPLLLQDSPWRQRLATAVQGTIYAALLLLPASGLVLWVWMRTPLDLLGLVQLPPLLVSRPDNETTLVVAWYLHVYVGWALLGLVGLHVGAALWHQFVLRDRRITRRL